MAAAGYATLWEFAVAPAKQAEFEAHYGPGRHLGAAFPARERLSRQRAVPDRSNRCTT